ncbi:MAG: HEPN domain-containing protein [Salinibacter sp.]
MKQQTRQLIEKADDAIEAAEMLRSGGLTDFAAGRAYYAMFYVAEALLFEQGLSFSKHSGVHAAFGRHFAKTGELDSKFHRYLLEAFESRIEGDYGVDVELTDESVEELVRRAHEFRQAARAYLAGD